MAGSVDELKTKLAGSIKRRAELAYQLADGRDCEFLGKIATVQMAITAIEAVIASGAYKPGARANTMILTFD